MNKTLLKIQERPPSVCQHLQPIDLLLESYYKSVVEKDKLCET